MPLKSIGGLASTTRFSLDPSFGSSWAGGRLAGAEEQRPDLRVRLVLRPRGGVSMRTSVATCIFLAATVLGAAAQSASPQSTDNRQNITSQTHCKDKAGNVWLKSSAELAGRTDPAQTTSGAGTSGQTSPAQRAPVETAGGPNMTEIAKTLPDCP